MDMSNTFEAKTRDSSQILIINSLNKHLAKNGDVRSQSHNRRIMKSVKKARTNYGV